MTLPVRRRACQRRPRVLVGAFQIECNSFVEARTTLADFARQTYAVGEEIGAPTLGTGSELAGAWEVLDAAGAGIVGSVVAASSPGPALTGGALGAIVTEALARADRSVDGVYFALHGSALAEGEDDPEGLLLHALRRRLREGVPVAISLDHHAHMTERMLDAVDIVTAYRTCPHTDLRERGAQAATILIDALAGRVSPVCRMARRPMITPADRHDSATEPFARLMATCDLAEDDGALAAALLPVQPWLDVPDLGWVAVVTTDADPVAARAAAETIAEAAWVERHAFVAGERPSPGRAVAIALDGPAPYVVADAGDATNGGAPGDSTEILRAALAAGRGKTLLSVCDAATARRLSTLPPGARVEATLGAGPPGSYNEQVALEARLVRSGALPLSYTHPAAPGRDDAGACALIAAECVDVVVHEHPVRVIDPALYVAAGADPAAYDVVQAKSQVSYRAGFAALTPRSVVADTAGPTTANLERLPYRRRPVPLFPFEDAAR